MTLQITGGIQDSQMDNLASLLTTAAGLIYIYESSGAPPVNAGAAINGTLLGTISVDGLGTGLHFESATGGVISKATAETWKCTVAESGVADYYRFALSTDTGVADNTATRVQGGIGELIGELLLADTNLVAGNEQRIDYYALGQPSE